MAGIVHNFFVIVTDSDIALNDMGAKISRSVTDGLHFSNGHSQLSSDGATLLGRR